jgi:phosphate transport system substrate-binding protein
MKVKILIYVFASLMFFLSGCSVSKEINDAPAIKITVSTQNPDILRISGSGSNIPITQALLDEYEKISGINIEIPGSIGSSGAIKALQAKKLDLGLISRSLKDSEKESGLLQKKYAQIGIVFGVHPSVSDENILLDDLINIYSGKKNKWSHGENIIVLIRENGDSSNSVLENQIPGFKSVLDDSLNSKRWEILYTDLEANDAIKNTKYSFGLTDTAALVQNKQTIKPLKYNNIAPTLDNMRNKSYPFVKDLYFAFSEPLSKETQKFLDFVYSEEGKNVILNYGGIPISGD